MKSFYFMLMACMLLATSYSAFGQNKKLICDYDKYANRHNANPERNALLDSACNEINKGKLRNAFVLLNTVAGMDSLATGEPDAYVDNQREKVYAYMEEAGESAPEVAETKAEPAPAPVVEEKTIQEETPAEEKIAVKEAPVKEEEKPEPVKNVEESTPVVKEEVTEPITEKVEEVKASKEAEPVAQEEKSEPSTDGNSAGSVKTEKSFSEEELKEFQDKGLQKIKLLEDYIKQIGSKSTSASIAMDATDNALKLFDEPGTRTVQVSSIKNPAKPKYKVAKYLEKLRLLNYDQIEVEWADFQYTSDFTKGVDGKWHGYVVFQQRFSAKRDDQVVYEDITTKRTEIILTTYSKAQEGVEAENWDVFLGDISVAQNDSN